MGLVHFYMVKLLKWLRFSDCECGASVERVQRANLPRAERFFEILLEFFQLVSSNFFSVLSATWASVFLNLLQCCFY